GLTTAKVNHTATLLPTGIVLIAGGRNSSGILASTELYTPSPADTMAPVVNQVTPPSGAHRRGLTEIIGERHSEPVDVRTLTATSAPIPVTPPGGNTTSATPFTVITQPPPTIISFTAAGQAPVAPGAATTGSTRDTTRPTVSATVPANAATGVATNGKIAVIFSEAMDPSTITKATFTLTQGSNPGDDDNGGDDDGPDKPGKKVKGTVSYAGVTATFTPARNLAPNTTYTAKVTRKAKDLAHNALASDFVWSFTTGATPDTTRPLVSSTVPANAATAVAINQKITAAFSEAMDPLTITTVTFTLKQGSTDVAGTVSYAGVTATFNPLSTLAANTTYTATMSTGAKDLAGNALAS